MLLCRSLWQVQKPVKPAPGSDAKAVSAADAQDSVTASKYGGKPYLSGGEQWPVCRDCKKCALRLWCQFRLDEAPVLAVAAFHPLLRALLPPPEVAAPKFRRGFLKKKDEDGGEEEEEEEEDEDAPKKKKRKVAGGGGAASASASAAASAGAGASARPPLTLTPAQAEAAIQALQTPYLIQFWKCMGDSWSNEGDGEGCEDEDKCHFIRIVDISKDKGQAVRVNVPFLSQLLVHMCLHVVWCCGVVWCGAVPAAGGLARHSWSDAKGRQELAAGDGQALIRRKAAGALDSRH